MALSSKQLSHRGNQCGLILACAYSVEYGMFVKGLLLTTCPCATTVCTNIIYIVKVCANKSQNPQKFLILCL